MTYLRLKVLVVMGAVLLVGCTTPLPNPVPPPASTAPRPLVYAPPAVSPVPAQTIAPATSDTGTLPGDQTPTPLVEGEPWTQRGLASWYGKRFNGRRTASGERFSAKGFTAAHRTLPIPSYVRVRRVARDRKSVV